MSPLEALSTLTQYALAGCPGSQVMDVDAAERALSSALRRLQYLEGLAKTLEQEAAHKQAQSNRLNRAMLEILQIARQTQGA